MLGGVTIYTKNMQRMADFYVRHFAFEAVTDADGRMIRLHPKAGGARISLHPAAKSQKLGQVLVKLSFDVEDVARFTVQAAKRGLKFGSIWKGDGYEFANAKDPDGNSISVSNRAFRLPLTPSPPAVTTT